MKPAILLRKQAEMRSSGYPMLMRVDMIFANSKLSFGLERIISAEQIIIDLINTLFHRALMICYDLISMQYSISLWRLRFLKPHRSARCTKIQSDIDVKQERRLALCNLKFHVLAIIRQTVIYIHPYKHLNHL